MHSGGLHTDKGIHLDLTTAGIRLIIKAAAVILIKKNTEVDTVNARRGMFHKL